MALVELPQTRTEVVAVYAHTVPQSLVHVIANLRESHYLAFQEEEYVECAQIRRPVLTGERLELRCPVANRVCYGMREESEDIRVDTGRELLHIHILHIYSTYKKRVKHISNKRFEFIAIVE